MFKRIFRAIFGMSKAEIEKVQKDAEELSRKAKARFEATMEREKQEAAKIAADKAAKTAADLKTLFDRYNEPVDFVIGNLVVLKEGLTNCKLPRYGEPALVADIIPGLIDSETEIASRYFKSDRSLKIAVSNDDGLDFYYMDIHRFKKFVPAPAEAPTAPQETTPA